MKNSDEDKASLLKRAERAEYDLEQLKKEKVSVDLKLIHESFRQISNPKTKALPKK
jgi:hypothetical protein